PTGPAVRSCTGPPTAVTACTTWPGIPERRPTCRQSGPREPPSSRPRSSPGCAVPARALPWASPPALRGALTVLFQVVGGGVRGPGQGLTCLAVVFIGPADLWVAVAGLTLPA